MMSEEEPNKICLRCKELKPLSKFNLTSKTGFSICKNCLVNDLEESSSEDWNQIASIKKLIERTLHENHVRFGGKLNFNSMSAIVACYVMIERLSRDFINDFGMEVVIEPLTDKLNTYQKAILYSLKDK